MPAFAAMLQALWDAGQDGDRWPKSYTCDLSTDYQSLLEIDEHAPFIWIVREMGTHLLCLDSESLRFTEEAARYFERQTDGSRWYVWNGHDNLSRVTPDHVRDLVKNTRRLAEEEGMLAMMERQWSNEVR
jgi:hypothetical protein